MCVRVRVCVCVCMCVARASLVVQHQDSPLAAFCRAMGNRKSCSGSLREREIKTERQREVVSQNRRSWGECLTPPNLLTQSGQSECAKRHSLYAEVIPLIDKILTSTVLWFHWILTTSYTLFILLWAGAEWAGYEDVPVRGGQGAHSSKVRCAWDAPKIPWAQRSTTAQHELEGPVRRTKSPLFRSVISSFPLSHYDSLCVFVSLLFLSPPSLFGFSLSLSQQTPCFFWL